ncbi:F-box and leucine-rich protein 22 isoform X2 [Conger conger]|uniref:F-box and leucine-rich protein 22 isoform X2 n=1 Tax=Conger conger TaxID=82655 RepID=UPI002A5ACE6C|nr:F-box and leucine-rich protein 22 isoform X2 [Conger conger]
MLLTQLNRECLLHVFSFLDKDGRRSLSLTCRGLRDVFLEPALWPLLRFQAPCELRRSNYVLGPALRHLSVCWHSSRVQVCSVEDWAKTPFQRDICRKHERTVSAFLTRVCESPAEPTSCKPVIARVSLCRTAKVLHKQRTRCPGLLSLTLSGCGHVEDQDVVQVLRSCRRLRGLRLENCARITDCVLLAAVAHGDSLAAAQVDFCRNVTHAGLQALRAGRPGVRLSAERSAGMIPDGRPRERPKLRRALRKVLLFS